ncbi:MAG: hypothetical protein HC896_08345 [Bacteroidales bacterium]|nr:hypothetical protein [Bacteroidales bacterium]
MVFIRHICNSAGIERWPQAHFEMARLGIGLHGISALGAGLLPVSTLKSYIAQVKSIKPKETIGYNRKGTLPKGGRIAIVPIGYADGLDRSLGNGNTRVNVNGQMAPTIGNICMDLCMIDHYRN